MNTYSEVKNIYPTIDTENEFFIEPSIEMMVKDYGIYYFSKGFKLYDEIVESILKKYLRITSNNKIKKGIFYAPNNELYSKEIDSSKYTDDVINNAIACYRYKNYEIMIGKEYLFFDDGTVKKISNINFENGVMLCNETNMPIVEEHFPKEFVNFIEEMKELSIYVDVSKNINPLMNLKDLYKNRYLEILIYMCFFGNETTSGQVFRLEQIARQFNIQSESVLEIIRQALDIEKNICVERIIDGIKLIPEEYKQILFIDLIVLDILGLKYNKNSDMIIKEVEKNIKIKYSEAEQIKRQLKNKLV